TPPPTRRRDKGPARRPAWQRCNSASLVLPQGIRSSTKPPFMRLAGAEKVPSRAYHAPARPDRAIRRPRAAFRLRQILSTRGRGRDTVAARPAEWAGAADAEEAGMAVWPELPVSDPYDAPPGRPRRPWAAKFRDA